MIYALAIGYMLVSALALFFFFALFGKWCMEHGVTGSETRAKAFAAILRGTEVCLALIAVYTLWLPILHTGSNDYGMLLFIPACAYTLVIGGVYVLGSLFALVTIPIGDQLAYFRNRLSLMQ